MDWADEKAKGVVLKWLDDLNSESSEVPHMEVWRLGIPGWEAEFRQHLEADFAAALRSAAEDARKQEREECAKVAEQSDNAPDGPMYGWAVAAAIRARSQR